MSNLIGLLPKQGPAMIKLLSGSEIGANLNAVVGMHRLRYRVFKTRLDWEVTTTDDLEADEFDTLRPVYILHEDEAGAVDGCVRLLPTTGPYMLRDVFPALLGQEAAPVGGRVWEASRFACDVSRCGRGVRAGLAGATFELFAAMIEFGLSWNLTTIVAVVDVRMERVLRMARWPLRRIGDTHWIGKTEATAGFLDVSDASLNAVRRAGHLEKPMLESPYPAVA
jgi:acyl homoserine lactone synthase